MSAALSFSGPVFERVDEILRDMPEYLGFRDGRRTRAEFSAFLERMRHQLVGHGVPPNDVHFAKRFPASASAVVEEAFAELAPLGLALPAGFRRTGARVATGIAGGFDHHGFGTYIYPEEGLLLLAIALAFRPRRTIFLGSYYGYWAAWAMPAIAGEGGSAVLVDPDPRAISVARASLRRLHPGVEIEAVCSTGEDYLAGSDTGQFDMVVLDAELPRTDPDPTRRGKGVYAHLLRAVLPRLAPRSLLVCHNILLQDHARCAFFDEVIARNREELGPFLDVVTREYGRWVELPTTEGVGVGLRG
ncbi:MAG: class I SAM-dependent methyltransferase [Pseudomonadota bacterium]